MGAASLVSVPVRDARLAAPGTTRWCIEVNPLGEKYGHVIVDEWHRVGALSFDAILKRTKAKYTLGLTATPFCRDGQPPIVLMHCGPIRHTAA